MLFGLHWLSKYLLLSSNEEHSVQFYSLNCGVIELIYNNDKNVGHMISSCLWLVSRFSCGNDQTLCIWLFSFWPKKSMNFGDWTHFLVDSNQSWRDWIAHTISNLTLGRNSSSFLDRIMALCEPLSTNGVVMDIHRSGQPAKMSPSAQLHLIMKSENIPVKLPENCGSLHHRLMPAVMTVQNWTSSMEYTASFEEQPFTKT